jgi:hypothetical protein
VVLAVLGLHGAALLGLAGHGGATPAGGPGRVEAAPAAAAMVVRAVERPAPAAGLGREDALAAATGPAGAATAEPAAPVAAITPALKPPVATPFAPAGPARQPSTSPAAPPAVRGSDAPAPPAADLAAADAALPPEAATSPPPPQATAAPPPAAEAPSDAPADEPPGSRLALATVAGPAGASAGAVAPTVSTAPQPALPRYRATLPPAFEARFQTRRGVFSGQADWTYAPEGTRYRLELHTRVLGREISHLRSEGRTAAGGLEPLRFVDGRRGRDQRAVNFQRDAADGGHISFSGPSTQLPLPAGVQDRLSWLLQLAAIVDTDPALQRRGARVSMWVVSPRGEADVWSFVVVGSEPVLQDTAGAPPALVLQRAPDRAFDTEVQVWLDPANRHLPLRATWRSEGDSAAVDLRREALSWR